jgi:hypothetical protein
LRCTKLGGLQRRYNTTLASKHGEYEMVLTNPPSGKKSSVTIVNEAGDEEKQAGRG